jgi:ERCC4-type nuclease
VFTSCIIYFVVAHHDAVKIIVYTIVIPQYMAKVICTCDNIDSVQCIHELKEQQLRDKARFLITNFY